ncbi:hypothetical protein VKT23_014640 [Stygiomarasmius scandens]|uniref:Berberine/berberine-like domain-containing protein n=1 Tax=Marasmiellus scandens TaxID=2682957 RepID=A0ABR1J4H3_9AGAR
MLFVQGGGNNFGIVTKFFLKTYPQNQTYGGSLIVPGKRAEEFKSAFVNFVDNEKRKAAAVVAAFRHTLQGGDIEYTISILCVFDGPKPKRKRDVPFQEFQALAKDGDVWTYDPVKWQLAKNEPISERTQVKVIKRKSFPSAQASSRSRIERGYRDSMRESSDDSDDNLIFDDGFTERDFCQWYGVKSGWSPGSSVAGSASSHGSWKHYPTTLRDSDDDENTIVGSDVDFDEDDSDSDSKDCGRYYKAKTRDSWKPMEDWEVKQVPTRQMIMEKVDNMGEKSRGRFGCLMILRYMKLLLDKMAEEAEKSACYIKSRNRRSVIVDAWPVHPEIFDNSPKGAAFPHTAGDPYGPLLAYFQWEREDDTFWINKLKGTLNRIHSFARKAGLTPRKPAYYSNLSLETVPVHKIYRGNMEWLMKVKNQYDPTDVMGQAGGHKINSSGNKENKDSD